MALNVIALSPWGPACAVMQEGPCEAAQASVWRFPHPRPRGWWIPRTEATGDAHPPGLDWAAPPLPQTSPSLAVTRAPCPSRWLQAGPQGAPPLQGGGCRWAEPASCSPALTAHLHPVRPRGLGQGCPPNRTRELGLAMSETVATVFS